VIVSTLEVDLGNNYTAKWRSDRNMVELLNGQRSIVLVEERDLERMMALFNEGRALEEVRKRLKA
jgi:phage portal protein BeeE